MPNSDFSPLKLGTALAEELRLHPEGESLEIIVELEPQEADEMPAGLSRREVFSFKEASFERRVAPIEAVIRHQGGTPLGKAWINDTLKARLPRPTIADLAQRSEIARVDLPRPLEQAQRSRQK